MLFSNIKNRALEIESFSRNLEAFLCLKPSTTLSPRTYELSNLKQSSKSLI